MTSCHSLGGSSKRGQAANADRGKDKLRSMNGRKIICYC